MFKVRYRLQVLAKLHYKSAKLPIPSVTQNVTQTEQG